MADAGVGELAAVIIATGASVYAASQTPKAPTPPKLPMEPKKADTGAVATQTQQADLLARSAGGTILSDPKSNRVGDGANTVRKSLLGS